MIVADPQPSASRSPISRRRALTAALLAALLALLAVASGLLAPAPARAAQLGPALNGPAGRVGAYALDGRLVYCLEPEKPMPLGRTISAGHAEADRFQIGRDELARVNWLISTHGQTTDAGVAAAVALFVWSTVRPAQATGPHGLDPALLARVPEESRGPVLATLELLRAAAATITADLPGLDRAMMRITADAADGRLGEVELSLAAPSDLARVELEGAVFAETGSAAGDLRDGARAAIAVPGDGGATLPTVRAAATVERPDLAWNARVEIFETPGAQLLGGAGGASRAAYRLTAEDDAPRTPSFAPIVRTSVSAPVVAGAEPLEDAWTVSLATGSSWTRRADGAYAPVLATGTLYGPFDEAPTERAEAPADAPVAAIVDVTLGGGTADPTGSVALASTARARDAASPLASGWYTWVVEIREDAQPEGSARVLPVGYAWRDAFGARAETALVAPSVRTEAQPEATAGGTATDTAIIDGLVPAGATIEFALYPSRMADGTPVCEAPVAEVAPTAVPAGRHEGLRVTSAPVLIADAGEHWWVERLRGADGSLLHEGECGAAAETTVATGPRATPSPTPSPAAPAELATTGAGGALTAGIGGIVLALGAGAALRLAGGRGRDRGRRVR